MFWLCLLTLINKTVNFNWAHNPLLPVGLRFNYLQTARAKGITTPRQFDLQITQLIEASAAIYCDKLFLRFLNTRYGVILSSARPNCRE